MTRDPFWEETEATIGEPVLAYGLGQYISGRTSVSGPLWGLLYVSRTAVFFRHFTQRNWITALIQTTQPGAKAMRDPEVTLRLPFAELSHFEEPEAQGPWRRPLCVAKPRRYFLHSRHPGVEPFCFVMENNATELITAMRAGICAGVGAQSSG